MTRDILDKDGNVMGQLTLPDETTEEGWAAALSIYSAGPAAPPSLTLQEIIQRKIAAAIQFGNQFIVDAATENVIQGITQAGKTKEVSDFLSAIVRYLREGSLYAALAEIDFLVANGIPEGISPWVTVDKLQAAKIRIQIFLGIPQ